MSDHYRTIATRVEHRIKIERSEFLGIAFPVSSEDEFFAELTRIEKQHFDATHHCWAFRLFAEQRSRSSDAGEPSGTAGKPILNATGELFDVGVVVVRWYGGIKLGTGGLSRAYRESASEALRHATLVDRYVYEHIEVIVPFDALGMIYRLVNPPDIVLTGEQYGDENVFSFDIRSSQVEAFKARLREQRFTLR
ncbi:MAG: YigZ family protein [Acidobacteria bacterium]|nr:MAG: YigZ family protein [Acidobacteriota bacterium]